MNRIFKKALCLLCSVVTLCGCQGTAYTVPDETVQTEAVSETAENIIPVRKEKLSCTYYTEYDFNLHTAAAELYETDGEILCGTVPHHLTAGKMIAGFLKTAASSRTETETVFITATMHYPEGAPLCTSFLDWSTPFGTAECDTEMTEQLASALGAETDDDMASLDHSVSALIPYVKYYFPEAKIAFLLVANSAPDDTPEKISALLEEFAEEKNCLFVFSADFSHYLKPFETEIRDEETLEAVMAQDYARVAQMTDSNVDSPHCLGTFMRLSSALGGETVLLDHSNSFEISDLPYNDTTFGEGLTSYFVFASV